MKKLITISLLLIAIVPILQSQSYKFIAMDRYYDTSILIDSVLVHNMKSGEDEMFFTDSIYLETITSVEDYNIESALKIYPNPVEDVLNIELSNINNSKLIITDVTGKVHFAYNTLPNQKLSFNVAGLPTGVYNISYGQHTQKFIKNSVTNGSVVNIISSEGVQNSLIKETEVQSQFDYRFTIYCTGFKPKSYYSEAITKDSIITLDMSSLPTSFDGKHIRVEFSLNCKISEYWETRNDKDFFDRGVKNITFTYEDTLVIRNNKIETISGEFGGDYPFNDHYIKKLKFEIDSTNKTISNFYFLESKKVRKYSSNTQNINKEYITVLFNSDLSYINELSNLYLLFLNENIEVKYEKENIKVDFETYEDISGELLTVFIPEESYIKIEIID